MQSFWTGPRDLSTWRSRLYWRLHDLASAPLPRTRRRYEAEFGDAERVVDVRGGLVPLPRAGRLQGAVERAVLLPLAVLVIAVYGVVLGVLLLPLLAVGWLLGRARGKS